MSQPERYGSMLTGNGAAAGSHHLGNTSLLERKTVVGYDTANECSEIPALQRIGQRLEALSTLLGDANITTRVFIDRVAGSTDPVQGNKGSAPNAANTIAALIETINGLEARVVEANQLSNQLGRIG